MLVITRRYIYIWVTVPLSDPDVLDFFWCKKNYLVVALVRLAKRFKIWKVQESQSCTIFSLFFVWVLSKTHSENTFTVSSVVKSISQSNPSWIRCFCWSPVRMGQHWCPKKCVSVAKIERVLPQGRFILTHPPLSQWFAVWALFFGRCSGGKNHINGSTSWIYVHSDRWIMVNPRIKQNNQVLSFFADLWRWGWVYRRIGSNWVRFQ